MMENTANRKLEAARLKKRWSIGVASKKIGVSVNTFNRWERGLQRPQPGKLDLLCKAFTMSPEELGFAPVDTTEPGTNEIVREPADNLTRDRSYHAAPREMTDPLPQSQQSGDGFTLYVEQVKKSLDMIHQARGDEHSEGILRKQAIAFLVSALLAVFGLARDTKEVLLSTDEILSFCTTSLPLCWQLYYEGGFVELSRSLPGYITQLSALAQSTSRHQSEAANLASQAHQLGYLLALQRRDYGTSLKHTRVAAQYGEVARDANLQTASLARKAYVYSCLHRYGPKLLAYQEALRLCNHCSPLLRGYVYAGLAETYAGHGDESLAREFLQRAREHYPDRPEDDPVYSYTHFRWSTFYNFAGKVYLHLHKPRQAWDAFANVERLVPVDEEPYRVELMVNQATTALALEELEQSCVLLTAAVKAARALGSDLRFDEAYTVYEQMQDKWGQESLVKELADLFN
ncbi:MAG TPA: helix-turn-helix domain-containing protein [Ktedonobacteraceae bacterium]|nr:helix-turn-helix domain-containing protein [Ktedonobacteraceae bacterium]